MGETALHQGPSGSTGSAAVVRPERALIERERELAALELGIDAAKRGSGSVVTIEGPAGIGKTSLRRGAGALAQHAGLEVTVARAAPIEARLPHGVARQLFEPLLRRRDPDALHLLPAVRASDPSAPDRTGAMPHALYRLSVELATATPLLLCIDDGHLCDAPSLRFLAYLVRRIEDLPVLVVLAARSGEGAVDDEAFLDVVTSPAVVALEPQPLTAAGVAAVIEAGLHVAPDPAFALACHRATGGNPFLAQELVAALAADRIEPAAAALGRIGALSPAVLARAVAVRLARLPGRALELARAVAVLGDGAPLHLAAELAGLELSAALEAADVLSAAEVLGPRQTMGADRALEFVHPLVKAFLEDRRGRRGQGRRAWHRGADPGADDG